MAACVAFISSGLPKPFRTTGEPAAARARAIPSPIPLVEPVTKDTLSLSGLAVETPRSLMAIFMAGTPRLADDVARVGTGYVRGPIMPASTLDRKCPLAKESIGERYGR